MSKHHDEGLDGDGIERAQEVDARHAVNVKGGFNPQPEPPTGRAPIIRFVINPSEIRG